MLFKRKLCSALSLGGVVASVLFGTLGGSAFCTHEKPSINSEFDLLHSFAGTLRGQRYWLRVYSNGIVTVAANDDYIRHIVLEYINGNDTSEYQIPDSDIKLLDQIIEKVANAEI